MRALEFISNQKTLCLFARPGVHSLLEAYDDPANELEISFREAMVEFGKHYYYGTIREKDSGNTRLIIQFTLDENNRSELDIGNIEPILQPGEEGKPVHSSLTLDNTGIDLGSRGVRWMLKKIKEFVNAEGFNPTKIGSSTRYTGARAKNNPGTDSGGLPKHFDVNKTLRETIVLKSTNEVKYYLVAD